MLKDFLLKAFMLGLAISTPFLLAHEAHAADLWLDVNLASYHVNEHEYTYQGKTEDFNQFNYGLGLTLGVGEVTFGHTPILAFLH